MARARSRTLSLGPGLFNLVGHCLVIASREHGVGSERTSARHGGQDQSCILFKSNCIILKIRTLTGQVFTSSRNYDPEYKAYQLHKERAKIKKAFCENFIARTLTLLKEKRRDISTDNNQIPSYNVS